MYCRSMGKITESLVRAVMGATFLEDLRLLQPTQSDDAWSRIPWRTQIMEALRESSQSNKAILLWIMVGNPQGCT